MANQIFKEVFTGKYHGVTPGTMLAPGAVSNGKNMRKVSSRGGWKMRQGCSLYNSTTAGDGAPIRSIHQYTNPLNGDYHLIVQVDNKLYYT